MTDNRTNGQIVAKALVAHCEDHKMPFPRGSVKKIVEALRVAGRLAGEPTEAQVDEAALAEVIAKVTDLWDEPLDEVHDIPQIARAVAAWLKDGAMT